MLKGASLAVSGSGVQQWVVARKKGGSPSSPLRVNKLLHSNVPCWIAWVEGNRRQSGDWRSRERGAALAVGRGVEGDVDDSFEFDGGSLFGGGAELPLAGGVHSVGIELLVDSTHQFDAVDGAVTADYAV